MRDGARSRRGWRSGEEIAALVGEYNRSGLSQREYSVREGVALSTLSLYLRRARAAVAPEGTRLIPVQVLGGATLVLVQSSGMRIEVGAGFDPDTLRRLLEALEA